MTTRSDSPPVETKSTPQPSDRPRPAEHTHEVQQHAFSHQSEPLEAEGTSSPPSKHPAFQYNASLYPIDTATGVPTFVTHRASPLSTELRLQTVVWPSGQQKDTQLSGAEAHISSDLDAPRPAPFSGSGLPVRSSSVKSLSASHRSGSGLSPASAASSPGVGPLSDITPLPSPIGVSPSPWSRMPVSEDGSHSPTSQGEGSPTLSGASPPRKRKAFVDMLPPPAHAAASLSTPTPHNRNRSLSEYVPPSAPSRSRNIAVSGSQTPTSTESQTKPMQREEYLAVQRGISSLPTPRPPTPPRSNRSATGSSDSGSPPLSPYTKALSLPRYEATIISTGKTRRWTAVRQLGTGTFSRVMLATSDSSAIGKPEEQIDRKSLVAVKVCEHGPAGGADEKKIESSLKRELDILKAINHPSLVHLKAVNILEKRAYLVLNYCPGGDMFELASLKLSLLVPSLVQRIFAELVAAVRYLHELYIVHRDIKLENVLLNVPITQLPSIRDWQVYPDPIVTLTDLGLGRYIPEPPASPLLNTRCGSEDYAAPELLMGQEYDGRSTDAWALGVLLYAIMEGRLPFDPVPGARRQSPTSHRIARVEWSWVKYADRDGDWDETKGEKLEGARQCVEGLLKRSRNRWTLEKVSETEWVKGAVQVEGGLKTHEYGED